MTEPQTEEIPRRGRGTQAETPEGSGHPLPWSEVVERLPGRWFWLTSLRPDGAPHTRPVLAAWSGSSLFVASKDTAQKSRNLAADGRCSLGSDTGDLHVVVEGTARHVADDATLGRASEAFERAYSWPSRVADGRLDAEYGAPTSGGPPYDVWEVTPERAYAFPTGEGREVTPTRWRFSG